MVFLTFSQTFCISSANDNLSRSTIRYDSRCARCWVRCTATWLSTEVHPLAGRTISKLHSEVFSSFHGAPFIAICRPRFSATCSDLQLKLCIKSYQKGRSLDLSRRNGRQLAQIRRAPAHRGLASETATQQPDLHLPALRRPRHLRQQRARREPPTHDGRAHEQQRRDPRLRLRHHRRL